YQVSLHVFVCICICYLNLFVKMVAVVLLTYLPTTSTDRYIFINQTKTWPQARAYCRLHHTDLTSVRNDTENGLIQQVVPGGQRAWIGLRRDTWRWWRSSKSSFRNWAAGHPLATTGNCAASVINATHLGKWVENHCDQKRHFMCDNSELFSS
uniref:C-type lectin domain-containing protein n=1 Tax=Seriola lalandi dorsalis TaxID=1841481 RepID=A0A3B4X5P4_SERLL